jgi:hypothetical protein
MRERSLEIPKDTLDGRKVMLAWIMHVKAYLLNDVGDVERMKMRYYSAPMRFLYYVGSAARGRVEAVRLGEVLSGVVASCSRSCQPCPESPQHT